MGELSMTEILNLDSIYYIVYSIFITLFAIYLYFKVRKYKKESDGLLSSYESAKKKESEITQDLEEGYKNNKAQDKTIKGLLKEKNGVILFLKTLNEYSLYKAVKNRAETITGLSESNEHQQTGMLKLAIDDEIIQLKNKAISAASSTENELVLEDELQLGPNKDLNDSDIPSIHNESRN
jgi:hypothetical protein